MSHKKRSERSSRYADAPYAVGKGKPPQHSRFQPGQSGNPKGRPKKLSAEEQIKAGMREAIEGPVTINTPSGSRQVPALVAMILKVRQKVIENGSSAQLQKFLAIIDSYGALTSDDRRHIGGVLIVPPRCETAEEWERIYGRAAGALTPEELEAERQRMEDLYSPKPAAVPAPVRSEPKRPTYVMPGPPVLPSLLENKPKKEPPRPEPSYVLPGPPVLRYLLENEPKKEPLKPEPGYVLPGPPLKPRT